MLYTQDITFSYPNNTLLKLPNLTCEASKVTLITGDSGKGKTTYLHLLAGILSPASGEIYINNIAINSLTTREKDIFRGKNIGIIFQNSYFINSLSVLENIEMASWLVSKNKNTLKAKTLLEDLDLLDYQHKLPSQLSIGQQQRVSIAKALINQPKLLLADEPTSSLDNNNVLKVSNLLENLAKKHQAALVIVTHDQRLKDKFENQITLY
jgi:ABC-type lipoprotein export system ATPase subunit